MEAMSGKVSQRISRDMSEVKKFLKKICESKLIGRNY